LQFKGNAPWANNQNQSMIDDGRGTKHTISETNSSKKGLK